VRAWALLLVALAGLALVAGTAALPPVGAADAPVHEHVGRHYLEEGAEATGLENIVTAVLLHFRGFDTFGEVVVIFTALAAVLGLPLAGLGRARRETPAEPGGAAPEAPPAGAPTVQAPSAPVDAGDEVPVSPVVRYVVRSLAPFIALFALATLAQGHAAPGGGFQAAAVLAALFVALSLAAGRARAARLLPRAGTPWLQAAAPAAFVIVAALGAVLTGAFLGYPADAPALRAAMSVGLEIAIAVGGAAILAHLFQALEA
jgi:multicomponent Na+:H+ antiporter subunit B